MLQLWEELFLESGKRSKVLDSLNQIQHSKKRNACIKLLNILLDYLLKWFAPILSFTTEEIYKIIKKEETDSIHLKYFPKMLAVDLFFITEVIIEVFSTNRYEPLFCSETISFSTISLNTSKSWIFIPNSLILNIFESCL